MNIRELCEKIKLQPSMTDAVINCIEGNELEQVMGDLDGLMKRDTWDDALDIIKKKLGEDKGGVKILACMLIKSAETWDKYVKSGLSETVLIETYKCYTRFVEEHMTSFGTYGFDRDFWTPRQASGLLLRIGELEYEMVDENGKKEVAFHIPSDAVFTKENIDSSIAEARVFIEKYYPEYLDSPMTCNSWLLAPALKELLPVDSNIISFQNRFEIKSVDLDAPDILQWVFKNPKISIEDGAEETSLQRKMKAYYLDGNKVGLAYGYLK